MPTTRRRYLMNEKPAITRAELHELKLQPNDVIREHIAACVIDRHRVTLRIWRRQGRGPAYIKDAFGNIQYRYGDLLEYFKSNTIDPSKLKGTPENTYRLAQSSNSIACGTKPAKLPVRRSRIND